MKRSTLVTIVLAGVLLLVLTACGGEEAPSPTRAAAPPTEPAVATEPPAVATEPPAVALSGDAIRGGLLYDKWWKPLGLDQPADDHPLWAGQDANERGGADTWRCKECHGWDYKGADGAYGSGSHFTGFAGVLDAADQGAEYVLGALEGETNPDHDFSVMDEQALIDLALFIAEETMDYDQFVSEDKMAAGGDLAVGEELFVSECGGCHGLQGTALNFGDVSDPEYIAGLALGNPWEFAHKMRFGQPDQPGMTSAVDIGWTLDEQLAVLAFAQSLPTSSPVEGGLLYDKWWKALGADEPDGEQALWASQSTNEREGPDTWRCKECHGWDYRGADGAYGSGSHYTGFVGVQDAGSMSAEDLVAWLVGATNPDHDFSGYLEGPQIDMLVAFLQGAPDTSEFINADKTVNGDPDNGKALYDAGCALCHGDDGQQINFGGADEPEYVGTLASGNPWEVFHKVSYGNPGSSMPSGVSLGWSFQDIADVVAYAQTLPAE